MRVRLLFPSPGAFLICGLGVAHAMKTARSAKSGTSDQAGRLQSLRSCSRYFTNQPLSIQVHPDDAFAHSIGLPRGKTEAWYVLSATPQAKVALGLDRQMTIPQLRDAIDDGSIPGHVVWQSVLANDAIFVPAGTIHAIGAGLV